MSLPFTSSLSQWRHLANTLLAHPCSVSVSPVQLVPISPVSISWSHEELHHGDVHRAEHVLLGVHLHADTVDDGAVRPVTGHLPDQELDLGLHEVEDHGRERPATAAGWKRVTRRQ